jgi:Helix-turn-helix domain
MSDQPELPSKNDFAIAFKAIALLRGLSGDAKTVAAVILSHFNAKTGQCDPGTERLMAKAGVSKRTVVNATNELHARGLVVKIRNGGNGFRSRYQPKWSAFRQIVADFEKSETTAEQVQERAPEECKNVHLDGAKACTLTHIRNSSKELTGAGRASGRGHPSKPTGPTGQLSVDRLQRLLSGSVNASGAIPYFPPSVEEARSQAWMRIQTRIDKVGPTMRSVLDGALTPDVRAQAITAEQKTQGSGFTFIWNRVTEAHSTAGVH